jgi:uncharacterized protein YjcR
MHGGAAGSGAPRGNQNALKEGFYTADALMGRQLMHELVWGSRQLTKQSR